MNSKIVTTLIAITAVALVATALPANAAAAKQELTKDFAIRGTTFGEITAFDPATGILQYNIIKGGGVMSHAGSFTLTGAGWMNVVTGEGENSGVFIAANGDEIPWDGFFSGDVLTVIAKPGSTGRFSGGLGGFVANIFDPSVDFEAGTLQFSYVGEGQMTFPPKK